jgi:hypothetical protein
MKSSAIRALGFTLVVSAAALTPTTTFSDEAEPTAYRVVPIRRPPGHEERSRAAAAQAEAIESARLAPALEEESSIKPTPRRPVIQASSFAGMNFATRGGTSVPPDTIAATGPNHIVEIVNASIAFYDRATGAAVGSTPQLLETFFNSVNFSNCIFDPVVAYDEIETRFVVAALDVPRACNPFAPATALILYAVSNSSDPTAGFSEMHSINVAETSKSSNSFCSTPETVGGDFTRIGWNADAYVITINMFGLTTGCYDHVSILTIDKTVALDSNAATVPAVFHVDRDGFDHFTLRPAIMHESIAGDPMWFVEESPLFFNTIRVVKMTNVLSTTPTFADTDIAVDAYGSPPSASQKGGGKIDAGDTRILHVESRGDRLVASQTVGISAIARARWYEFDTSDTTPALTQQGTINRGSGIHTYYPSIAIAPNGDLGMTFMQSSSNEYMSMYVTGQREGDPPGTMQFPVLAKAGQANYRAFDCFNFNTRRFTPNTSCRAGDYSGITVDPDTPDTFCAANEYADSPMAGANWGTWIACFSLVPLHDLAVTGLNAPKTASGSPVTLPVTVTIQNRSDHNETIPDNSALGDGTGTGLVRLAVNIVDNDHESCLAAGIALNDTANAALFSGGPKVLAPTESITVNFQVTYNCAVRKNLRRDRSPGDYNHTATVHHEALDGDADDHTADDICPRLPLPGKFDPNPPGIGSKDPGCGAKKTKTTFGNPVVTNVVP